MTSCASTKEFKDFIFEDRTIPTYVTEVPKRPVAPPQPRTNGDMYLYRKNLVQHICRLEGQIDDIVKYSTRGKQSAPSDCGD